MRECIEEGILQSYIDGELSPEIAERVTAHLAACSNCAEALDEINNEMAMLSTAFEAEMALDVPTIRLRERLDAAIAEMNQPVQVTERKQGWSLTGLFASFGELFKVSPQRAIGFASLIAVIAFAAIFAAIRLNKSGSSDNANQFVADKGKPAPTSSPVITNPSPSPTETGKPGDSEGNKGNKPPVKHPTPKKQAKPILVPQPDQLPQGDLANKTLPSAKPLPGE